jgi:hypothetical protein
MGETTSLGISAIFTNSKVCSVGNDSKGTSGSLNKAQWSYQLDIPVEVTTIHSFCFGEVEIPVMGNGKGKESVVISSLSSSKSIQIIS